jgi:ABC-type spermidine/putrescine transport system permease subunit II
MLEHWKNIVDGLAVSVGIAAITALIPIATGVLTIIWLVYRVKEIRLSVKIKEKQLSALEE